MSGGYRSPVGSEYDSLVEVLREHGRRLAELEAPTGTSVNSLVQQVQAAIANIGASIDAWLTANSYTTAQIDSLVANPPGNVTVAGSVNVAGSVTSAGQVDSAGAPLKSEPSYNYMVATAYKGAWIDGATYQIGYSPSTESVKTGLTPLDASDVERLLGLTPYWGRYLWDAPDSPLKVFLLAGDVQAAGFGPDVAPVVETEPLQMYGMDGQPILDAEGEPIIVPVGEAYSVNYSQLVVPAIAALQSQHAQIEALRGEVATIRAHLGI